MINIVNQGPTLNTRFKQRIDQETGGNWYGKAYHIPLDTLQQDEVASQLLQLKSQLDQAKLNALNNPSSGFIQHQAQATQTSWEMSAREEHPTNQAVDKVLGLAAKELNPEFPDYTLIGSIEKLGRNDMIRVGARGLLSGDTDFCFMPQGLLFVDYTPDNQGIDIVLARRDEF